MRQGQQGKRPRGRGGRRPHNTRNQVFDSNGPSVRIRGNALQIYEKYQQLARDSSSSGDRISAENLLQHAEHYYRIHSANTAANGGERRPRPESLDGDGGAANGAESQAGNTDNADEADGGGAEAANGSDKGEAAQA